MIPLRIPVDDKEEINRQNKILFIFLYKWKLCATFCEIYIIIMPKDYIIEFI
jgi:hypothetical protein